MKRNIMQKPRSNKKKRKKTRNILPDELQMPSSHLPQLQLLLQLLPELQINCQERNKMKDKDKIFTNVT
jgi:hypothetical protein